MILLYVIVGGITGFVIFGAPGALFGIGLGIAFSVSQSAEKKARELEHKVQLLEFQLNNEMLALKDMIDKER